ncbi:MAG: hypothetical protein IME98_04925, partial [Proteobacteria bacterium]|nr:hypothetical protein [Pseudomonadota bacterium]
MKNLLELLASLSTGKKISFAVITVVSIIALISLFAWANRPNYQVLFSDLTEDDASRIIERLQSDNIQYQVSGSGSISIPSEL